MWDQFKRTSSFSINQRKSLCLNWRYQSSVEILDYATTKAAVVGFTKDLADAMGEKGIRVNCVEHS